MLSLSDARMCYFVTLLNIKKDNNQKKVNNTNTYSLANVYLFLECL